MPFPSQIVAASQQGAGAVAAELGKLIEKEVETWGKRRSHTASPTSTGDQSWSI
jgi:hypothetical protein